MSLPYTGKQPRRSPYVSPFVATRVVSGWHGTLQCRKIDVTRNFSAQQSAMAAFLCRKIAEFLKSTAIVPNRKALLAHGVYAWSAQACTTFLSSAKQGKAMHCAPDFKKAAKMHSVPAVYINAPSHPSPQLSFFSRFILSPQIQKIQLKTQNKKTFKPQD